MTGCALSCSHHPPVVENPLTGPLWPQNLPRERRHCKRSRKLLPKPEA